MTKGTGFFGAGVVFIAAVVGAALALWTMTGSGQAASTRVAIDGDDILGVVTTSNGSAASVWVIAQTTDLPTRFRKIAVTHDQGRYVLPVLPKASYGIWVRGHGLVVLSFRSIRSRAAQPGRRPGADASGSRRRTSGELLVLHDPSAAQERLPFE